MTDLKSPETSPFQVGGVLAVPGALSVGAGLFTHAAVPVIGAFVLFTGLLFVAMGVIDGRVNRRN